MSASDVPPCEVAISCAGIASTMALPPLCQVAPAGVTAPRRLDTLFSEVTTDGAWAAAGIQTGTVVSVPLGKPSACSARSPLAYGPLLARAAPVGWEMLIVVATPASAHRMPRPSTAAATRLRITRCAHQVQNRLTAPAERRLGQSSRVPVPIFDRTTGSRVSATKVAV